MDYKATWWRDWRRWRCFRNQLPFLASLFCSFSLSRHLGSSGSQSGVITLLLYLSCNYEKFKYILPFLTCDVTLKTRPYSRSIFVRLRRVQIWLPSLALKPRGDVTRSPQHGSEWPQKQTGVRQIFFKKNNTKNKAL